MQIFNLFINKYYMSIIHYLQIINTVNINYAATSTNIFVLHSTLIAKRVTMGLVTLSPLFIK